MINNKSKIQSILFVAGRPVKISEIAKAIGLPKNEISPIMQEIKTDFRHTGINLIEHDEKFQFVTNPENAKSVADFLNAELREKLTETAIETLAIILYKQPITRAEIEAIRGVNSQYILRHLSMRGLVEKNPSPEDARRLVYRTTLEFMTHMGIRDIKELPDFEELTKNVALPAEAPQAAPLEQQQEKTPPATEEMPVSETKEAQQTTNDENEDVDDDDDDTD